MKRIFFLVPVMALVAGVGPAWAQGNEIATLRAEIAKQEVVISQLLRRIEALEKQQPPATTAAVQDLQDDIKAQEDSVNSLREVVNSKVNLNGYYNFRFSADGSEEPAAFQQHHLGVLMAKQLGKFNFLMELELQNVPHHPEIAPEGGEEGEEGEGEAGHDDTDSAAKARWRSRTRGWNTTTIAFVGVRVGKQLSPQYWWQNHYPNLTLSTDAPDLPPRAVPGGAGRRDGAGERGAAGRHIRARRRLQVLRRQQQLRRQQPGRSPRRQIVGRARRRCASRHRARVRRFDVAADIYRGHVGLTNNTSWPKTTSFGFEIADRNLELPVSDRMGAGQVARADAHRLLPAAGVAHRRRLDHVLPRRAAREPAHPARRAAPHRRG